MEMSSSLPEAELQQQQQQQQLNQLVQPPNQPYYNNYYYDPSQQQQQSQAYYDHSYYSYYHYSQQPQPQQYDHQDQHYGYHNQQQQQQHQPLCPLAYYQPPRHQLYYNYQQQQQQHPPPNADATAAATAAFSQLTHFSGKMSAHSHHKLHPPIGQPPYWHGGKRHGRLAQASGQGNCSFHGRGGGKNKRKGKAKAKNCPKNSKLQDATSMSSINTVQRAESMNVRAIQATSENAGPPPVAPKKIKQFAAAPGIVGLNARPQQIAWCELCRVDCTSLEILEQHKNGKRHKKNLLRTGNLETTAKPFTETQTNEEAKNNSKSEAYQTTDISPDRGAQKPKISLEATNIVNGANASIQTNEEEEAKVVAGELSNLQERTSRANVPNKKRRGIKCKISDDQRGKRVKTFKTLKQPTEPRKPKVVVPLICDLCNVKCDTQEVLGRHLSGKKHIAKLKRFESHQALYGTAGIQALYPPNPISKTLVIPQAQGDQAFHGPQVSLPPTSQVCQAADAAAGLGPQQMQATIQSSLCDASVLTSCVLQQQPH